MIDHRCGKIGIAGGMKVKVVTLQHLILMKLQTRRWANGFTFTHTINKGMNIEEEHCTASVLMLNNTFEKCARVTTSQLI